MVRPMEPQLEQYSAPTTAQELDQQRAMLLAFQKEPSLEALKDRLLDLRTGSKYLVVWLRSNKSVEEHSHTLLYMTSGTPKATQTESLTEPY